jgi:Auxin canalisation
MKSWLREEIFSSLSKSCRRKRKEAFRFHEAQVHAALAVARLAAAIAGTLANSNIETSYISSNLFSLSKQRDGTVNEMSTVVASAAALVATVCAEAAEAICGKRSKVTSAIKMGLERQSSADMLTLTATAATCKCTILLG